MKGKDIQMNFFEGQFRKMLWGSNMIQSPFYVDGVCFGTIGRDHLVQMQFITVQGVDQFDVLEIVVVHRTSGQQETFYLRLEDIWGRVIILTHSGYSREAIPRWFHVKTNSTFFDPTWEEWKRLQDAVKDRLDSFYKPEIQPVSDHRLVYICAPLRGDVEQNIEYARQRAREVFQAGNIPVCPHLMFPPIADPANPVEDQTAREMGLRLVTLCQQVNVYGTCTAGMQEEIKLAARHGIPVQYLGKEASGHVE